MGSHIVPVRFQLLYVLFILCAYKEVTTLSFVLIDEVNNEMYPRITVRHKFEAMSFNA